MSKPVYFRYTVSGEVTEVSSDSLLVPMYSSREGMERLSAKVGRTLYREQWIKHLCDIVSKAVRPGHPEVKDSSYCTIYGLVRDVSRSGMARTIDFFLITDGQLVSITYALHVILGIRFGKHSGLYVAGGGMDMIEHVVDCLRRAVPELPEVRCSKI